MFNLVNQQGRVNKPLKMVVVSIMSFFILLYSAISLADDTIFYDSTGSAVAYSSNDVLYRWSGDPVAYVGDGGAVFGFNGKQLGWYSDGVIWDNNGYMVAFTPATAPTEIKINPVTKVISVKKELPTKTTAETVLKKPEFVRKVSPTPFTTLYIYEVPAQ